MATCRRPLHNEGETQYGYRLADEVREWSPKCKDIGLTEHAISAFCVLEPQIIADALQETMIPTLISERMN